MVRQRFADQLASELVGLDAVVNGALTGKKDTLNDYLELLRPTHGPG